jgi:hypothetical protein
MEQPNKATPTSSKTPYISNPFIVVINGIQALLHINLTTFIVTLLLQMAVGLLLLTFIGVASLTIVTLIAQFSGLVIPNTLPLQFFATPAGIALSSMAILCGVLLLVSMQTILFSLNGASAARQPISFGAILKQLIHKFLPMLGLFGLVVVGMLLTGVVAIVLARFSVPIAIIFLLISLLVGAYLGVRTSLAGYSVIRDNKNPLQAMTASWKLTQGHFFETLGVIFAANIIVVLPLALLDTITALAAETLIGALLQLVVAAGGMIAAVLVNMGTAERYQQLQAAREGKVGTPLKPHHANYWVLPVFILGLAVIGLLTPPKQQEPLPFEQPFMQQQQPSTPKGGLPQDDSTNQESYPSDGLDDNHTPVDEGPAYNVD